MSEDRTAPDWPWLLEHVSLAGLGWSADCPAPQEAMAALKVMLRQRAGRRADERAAGIEALRRAGRRAWEIRHGQQGAAS